MKGCPLYRKPHRPWRQLPGNESLDINHAIFPRTLRESAVECDRRRIYDAVEPTDFRHRLTPALGQGGKDVFRPFAGEGLVHHPTRRHHSHPRARFQKRPDPRNRHHDPRDRLGLPPHRPIATKGGSPGEQPPRQFASYKRHLRDCLTSSIPCYLTATTPHNQQNKVVSYTLVNLINMLGGAMGVVTTDLCEAGHTVVSLQVSLRQPLSAFLCWFWIPKLGGHFFERLQSLQRTPHAP